MEPDEKEEQLLRSTALQNAKSILLARQLAERELIEAKEALVASQARLQMAMQAGKMGDWEWIIAEEKVNWSPLLEFVHGIPEGSFWGTFQDYQRDIHPEDRARVLAGIQRCVEQSADYHSEYRIIKPDGKIAWLEARGKLYLDDKGVPERMIGICADVTPRKEAEHKLRDQNEWFRVTLASIGDGVVTVSTDCTVTFLNSVAEKLTGWSASDALGKPIGDILRIVNETTRKAAVNPIDRALADGIVVGLANHTILIRRDGSEIPIEDSAAPIKSASGEVIGVVMVFHDVTERRQKQRELEEEFVITETLYEVAIAITNEHELGKGVQIIIDAGTRLTRAQFGAFFYDACDENGSPIVLCARAGDLSGEFEEFPCHQTIDLFGPNFKADGVVRLDDARTENRPGLHSPYFRMPAGDSPAMSYLAAPVISRAGEVIGGLVLGHSGASVFTERDEKIIRGVAAQAAGAMDTACLYQAEQLARNAAEQANKAKDHFLAALSHELRTPLTPVIAILSSLRNEPGISQDLAVDLETVRRNVELEARLIDDLLDLTRITQGKLELRFSRARIGQMIEDAINTCLPDIKAKHLSFRREILNPDQIVTADAARTTQILWNLLKNSIKFTPDGGTITLRSRTATVAPDVDRVVIEVEDTGIGIDPGDVKRIFEAFEQGDRKITRQFGGLGLGLAISKAIAESQMGSLAAASEGSGKGSIFTLTLPLGEANELSTGPSENENFPSGDNVALVAPALVERPLRILLVEDHVDSAAVLSRLLRRMGHDVILAGSVAAGLAVAAREVRAGGIDLVMSDLGLPDGSGLDLMRQLSSIYSLRGIALSGYGMESDIEQSAAAGFSQHLIKPLDIALIRAAIARLMEKA